MNTNTNTTKSTNMNMCPPGHVPHWTAVGGPANGGTRMVRSRRFPWAALNSSLVTDETPVGLRGAVIASDFDLAEAPATPEIMREWLTRRIAQDRTSAKGWAEVMDWQVDRWASAHPVEAAEAAVEAAQRLVKVAERELWRVLGRKNAPRAVAPAWSSTWGADDEASLDLCRREVDEASARLVAARAALAEAREGADQ